MGEDITEYDITQNFPAKPVFFEKEDLLILAAPVYAGRIPAKALDAFKQFRGENALAVILCVYGNRAYDDALLEMKDLVEINGFKVVSAGAFIAQHSIFPKVGAHRPDSADLAKIHEMGTKSLEIIETTTDLASLPAIKVKGNKPYKIPSAIPVKPKGNKNCNDCGACVKLCPVQAISKATPRKTDREKCISCGRCVAICPKNARHFGGILYTLACKKFTKANSERKEGEIRYAEVLC
ncbi:MAG: 4Fe-4S binding protein [Bacteroidales bacterium]